MGTSSFLESNFINWLAPFITEPNGQYHRNNAAAPLRQPELSRGAEKGCWLCICATDIWLQGQREGEERSETAVAEVEA